MVSPRAIEGRRRGDGGGGVVPVDGDELLGEANVLTELRRAPQLTTDSHNNALKVHDVQTEQQMLAVGLTVGWPLIVESCRRGTWSSGPWTATWNSS